MRTALGWAALIAALVGTASAEYKLALACGFGAALAACVPAALDIYALAAFHSRKDVPYVVMALISVNAASHLVSSELLDVSVPLVVAVSAIAPLVLWRVHVLQASAPAAAPEMQGAAPEMQTDAAPSAPVALPDAAECTPDAVEMQADAPECAPDAPQPDAIAAPQADELLPSARELDAAHREECGRPVPLRKLQAELHIGQRRAMDLKAAMAPASAAS